MFIQAYVVIILAIYFIGMIDFWDKGKHWNAIGAGLNIVIWTPVIGRVFGWW